MQRFFLARTYEFCAANPARCDRAIDRLVSQVAALPTDEPTLDLAMIRAVVRTAASIADAQLDLAEGAARIVAVPLAGDLSIVPVAAEKTSMILLNEADLADLGLTADAAIALGIQNVAALLKPLPEVMMGVPGKAVARSDGDDFESSRILLHDDLAELSEAWHGRLIVAVPSSDTMLYGNGSRPEAIPMMRAAIGELMAGAQRPVSATLLLWTRTGWDVVPPLRQTLPPGRDQGSQAR
jgi:hypothetical protein